MSLLPSTAAGQSGDLTDGDLGQIVDAFRRSGRGSLDLRIGATRLRLGLPASQTDEITGVLTTATAPFVGVFSTDVRVGQAVDAGTRLGVIRSIRAETEVSAAKVGTITAQHAAEGSFVAFGDSLFAIKSMEPKQ
jgi:acetyl/propionyl-CoA carboxylase alpha subunit